MQWQQNRILLNRKTTNKRKKGKKKKKNREKHTRCVYDLFCIAQKKNPTTIIIITTSNNKKIWVYFPKVFDSIWRKRVAAQIKLCSWHSTNNKKFESVWMVYLHYSCAYREMRRQYNYKYAEWPVQSCFLFRDGHFIWHMYREHLCYKHSRGIKNCVFSSMCFKPFMLPNFFFLQKTWIFCIYLGPNFGALSIA